MACNGAYTMEYIIWHTLKYIITDKARHIQMHIIRNAVTRKGAYNKACLLGHILVHIIGHNIWYKIMYEISVHGKVYENGSKDI